MSIIRTRHMSITIRTRQLSPGYYVVDSFAATLDASVIAGPFMTHDMADADRQQRNIADDCVVLRVMAPRA